MTPEETKAAIGVMEAHLRGEEIEYTGKRLGLWAELRDPCWNWNEYDYRVKPEPPKPREAWAVTNDSGVLSKDCAWFQTRAAAEAFARFHGFSIIHVREVLEEQP